MLCYRILINTRYKEDGEKFGRLIKGKSKTESKRSGNQLAFPAIRKGNKKCFKCNQTRNIHVKEIRFIYKKYNHEGKNERFRENQC